MPAAAADTSINLSRRVHQRDMDTFLTDISMTRLCANCPNEMWTYFHVCHVYRYSADAIFS